MVSFRRRFIDQLIGMGIDKEQEIKVTFPEDYGAADLAGKEAVFKVTVHEIKEKHLPEIDDELAKDVKKRIFMLMLTAVILLTKPALTASRAHLPST